MPTLYTAERCPYAARTRITLAEKGIPYDAVEIDLSNRPAWLYEKNPLGRVPVYEEDEGLVLPESEVIMEYLEERFPEPALWPADPAERRPDQRDPVFHLGEHRRGVLLDRPSAPVQPRPHDLVVTE